MSSRRAKFKFMAGASAGLNVGCFVVLSRAETRSLSENLLFL